MTGSHISSSDQAVLLDSEQTVMATPGMWLYLLIGAVQGLALWALHEATQRSLWPATSGPWLSASLYAVLAVPAAWYLLHGGFKRQRTHLAVVGVIGGLYAGLGAHAGVGWVVRDLWPQLFSYLLMCAPNSA